MATLDPELHFMLDEYKKLLKTTATAPGTVNAGTRTAGTSLLQLSVLFTKSAAELTDAGMDVISVVGTVAYGQATLATLATLNELDSVVAIDKQRRNHLTLDKSVPDVRADKVWSRSGDAFTNGGQDVIVGIIDSGIDFTHLNFRKPNGDTRLLRIWDQTLNVATGDHSPGPVTLPIANSPQPTTSVPLGYGVEYTLQQIDEYLHNPDLTQPVRHEDQDGHGTHVAGIAAGSGAQSGGCHRAYHYVGMAPAADIIAVRLWGLSDSDSDTAPTGAGNVMLEAIMYILNVAKTLPTPKPVVINMSFGRFNQLMHGASPDSVAMDNLLLANSTGFSLVAAAGNDGASRFHVQGTVPAGPTASLPFGLTVGQQDAKERYFVILYTGSNLQIRLTSSGGTTGWVAIGAATPTSLINGTGSVTVFNSNNQIYVKIAPPSTPPVPPATTPTITGNNLAGNWTVELQDTGSTATAFDAFCLYGSTHDRQSLFFTKPTPASGQPDLVTVQATLVEQATTKEILTVGSYATENGILAPSSGRGLTLDMRQKPEITAPGDGILSTANAKYRAVVRHDDDCDCCANCCCTCCQDFYVTLYGTSMAAPHVAGAVALLFQKNKTLTHSQVKTLISSNARAVNTPVVGDQRGWGAGKLDVKAAFDNVPVLSPASPLVTPVPTPFVALPQSHQELLQDRLVRHPRWPEIRALYDQYADEIRLMINTNKRVATVWHRCGGPAWVRIALQLVSMPTMPIPESAGGCSLSDGIARMRAIIERYGSSALTRDIARYEADLGLLDSGQSLLQLINLIEQQPQPVTAGTY